MHHQPQHISKQGFASLCSTQASQLSEGNLTSREFNKVSDLWHVPLTFSVPSLMAKMEFQSKHDGNMLIRGGTSAAWYKGNSALGCHIWPATSLTDVSAALWGYYNIQPLLQLEVSMGSAADSQTMLSFFTLLSKTDKSVNHEDLLCPGFSLIILSMWFSLLWVSHQVLTHGR